MSEVTFAQAIHDALSEEMAADHRVVLFGEDVAEYGGAFKVTKGLLAQFGPRRVINTPISENSIVGLAVGAAMLGMRPVVELMFMDFVTLAMDQIVNHAAKFHYVYGQDVHVPLVIRMPAGGGRCYGPTHSQSLEAWLMHVPGLRVVVPSIPRDAKGMLKSAIRCPDPVVFIEPKALYSLRGECCTAECSADIEHACVVREGNEVAILTYGRMVHTALAAATEAEKLAISTMIVDLRSLAPLDVAAITAVAEKVGKVIVVEEDSKTMGAGAEIVSLIVETAFYSLSAPVSRVAARDVPIPCSKVLEDAVLPGVRDVVDAIVAISKL